MNSDYPERKHESPFADYPPQQQSPDSSPQRKPRNDDLPEFKDQINEAANLNNIGSERRMIPKLDHRIEVVYRRGSNVAMILIVLFSSSLISINLLASNLKNVPFLAIPFNLSVFGIIGFLIFNAKRNSVRSFDASGATRSDGRHFSWSDFGGTATRGSSYRSGGKSIWRVELFFSGGQARILPSKIKNGK